MNESEHHVWDVLAQQTMLATLLKKRNLTFESGVISRGFKKKKITLVEVQEALEKKKKQKRTFLDTYYAKVCIR